METAKWVFISLPGKDKPEDWSDQEVESTVADYMEMLRKELTGVAYNKTDHRNALLKLLPQRNKGGVEFKHCNISAVLQGMGLPSSR